MVDVCVIVIPPALDVVLVVPAFSYASLSFLLILHTSKVVLALPPVGMPPIDDGVVDTDVVHW